MWIPRSRLQDDVARWRSAGWVTEEGAERIGAEIAALRRGPGFAGVLAILGVVLLGFALMSFVAANWQDMSRLVRLAIIFAALLGSYAAAGALGSRGHDVFAEAAILAGVAAFGGGIMLIAQMYHIDGHPPDAVLTWAIGAMAAGLLLGSRPALGAAAALLGLWTGWETGVSDTVHLALLPAVGVLAAAVAVERWRAGFHLVALLLAGWVVKLGYVLEKGHGHEIVAVIGLAVAAAAVFVIVAGERRKGQAPIAALADWPGGTILGYGMATAFAGLWALQFQNAIATGLLIGLAGFTLALLVAAIAFGLAYGRRGAVWLGYTGFSVEILALYFKTVGTLLGSSVFFLVAGLIVIALAGLAYKLHHAGDLATGGTS